MSRNDNNSNKQQLDLTASLPVATGGLSMEDSVGPVNALKFCNTEYDFATVNVGDVDLGIPEINQVAAVPQNLVQSAEASTTTPTVNKLDYDGISLVGRKSKDVKPGEKNDSLDIPSQSVEDLMSDDDDDNNNKNNNIPNPAGSGYGEGSISDYVGISLQPYPTDEKKNDSLDIPEINQPDVTTPNLSHSDEASTSTPIIDCITDVNQTPYYVDKSDDETIDFLLDCAERGQNRGNQRPPSIFKVSRILGDHSESSFNPQLVSIGPIHREDPKLKEFEWLKECYLDDLLNRCDSTPKKTLEACLLKVNTLIDQIRESYPGVIKNYSDVELARMMVMDGCFILEFCFKHEEKNLYLPNKMQNNRIAMDLMLLENQVPFFVLQTLFDCSMVKVSFTLSNVLEKYLTPYVKLFRSQLPEKIATTGVDSDSTHDHVLGYLHKRMSQLKRIGATAFDFLENLTPAVRKRVEVLRGIQSEHDELEKKYMEERGALWAKYPKLGAIFLSKNERAELDARVFPEIAAIKAKYDYAPFYSKRYDIVTGAVEVDGAKEEDAMDQTDDTEKGVPEFWLNAMKHHKFIAEEITKRDEEALKYLKDIKWCHMDDKLEFFFDTNPFFTNSVLTKVCHKIDDDKPILEKAIGTTIEWLPGTCLTPKILKKKDETWFTKNFKSFFLLFSPPEDRGLSFQDRVPDNTETIFALIRYQIIPHAVSWFTGEANQKFMRCFQSEHDEDDFEDSEDEEETKTKEKSEHDEDDFEDSEDEEETKTKEKSQLKAKGGQDSHVHENLKPTVIKRVEVLRGIQGEHDELEAKFVEEKAKYQKLYASLYSKRYDIVTGAVEVDGAKEEDAMDQTDDTEKGVPEFWLTAMKHNKITAKEIIERDEEALKYLKDIKWCRMDDPKDFKLEFFFDTNPFFTNSVLTKVYHMRSSRCFSHKLVYKKASGTTIDWLAGKCFTEDYACFFNFFSPRMDYGLGYLEFGLTIRDKIIPHAVSWFMGEANQEDFGGFDDENGEDDDDEIEEDDDKDDEDDENEEETKTKNKSQLKAIGGKDSDVLENLKPTVRKRVEALRGIQSEHDELEAKFFEEKAKYQKLYASLYSKRYDIVNGAVEVDGAKEEDAMDQTDDIEKGVPEFWLTAMKHNLTKYNKLEHLHRHITITERDEEALKYLKDIKWCRMDYPKGFKLEFFFDTNPFFTNPVLTKVYHMTSSCYFDKLILEKAIGTAIEWLPGTCLTQMIFEMKPKKGSKNAKLITKTLDCASFFNFFSPRKEERSWMRKDYIIGLTIRDKIIPHAVSWFTGEANQEDFGGFDDEDEDYEDAEDAILIGSYVQKKKRGNKLGIPEIKKDSLDTKNPVALRIPSQSAEASITDVKPGKKNDSLDIPASSENHK